MRWPRRSDGPAPRSTPADIATVVDRLSGAVDAVYASGGDLAGLSAAIDVLDAGVRRLPPGHPRRGLFLAVLGEAFGSRFDLTNARADMESAVAFGERAVAEVPADDPQRGLVLGKLGWRHIMRFGVTGDRADLDAAIRRCAQAVAETGATPQLLVWSAFAHERRFGAVGDPADVDAQIRLAEHGLAITGPADPRRRLLLHMAASGHERRYARTGDTAALDAAIAHRATADAEDPDGTGPDAARNLSNLGLDHLDRYQDIGDPADVRGAVECGVRALATVRADDPDHAGMVYKLGMAYLARFRLAGDPADLQAYVAKAEESRRLASPSYRGEALVNLGVAYAERYEHTGEPGDLDASIDAGEEALAHPGVTGQHRSSCLANLSIAYRQRFRRFGARADLDHAIQLGGRALRALPDGHPAFASRVISLTNAYAARFDRDRDRADLDAAVELCERALAIAGTNQADRRLLRSNLGGHLLRRFQVHGDPADVDAAVAHGEQALDGTTDADPRWPKFAEGLAGALLHRHRLLAAGSASADLETAVDLIDRALAATRPDSTFFLGRVRNTAVAYQDVGIDPERRRATVRRLVEAADSATDPTPTELASTQTNIASLARQAGLLTEAATAYRKAVELLPRCAAPGLAWSDQEHQLSGSRGLVGEAVATHIAIGDAEAAVELAELGRGVLLSNQLNVRADPADTAALSRADPRLAAEFEAVTAEMDDRSRLGEPLHDLGGASARRPPARDVGDRWDQVIRRIRELPGFSDFLAPPRVAELQRAATGGAVVLVNVGSLGGHAVVLTPDAVTPVHLPQLTTEDAEAHANALAGVEFVADHAVPIARAAAPRGATHDLLEWLWEAVTEPVLTALGHRSPPRAGQPVPRVWWVPTGVLGLLPLHAAGLPNGPSALDRVVSSYAPSVRALLHARRGASARSRTRLTVTLRHTDGFPPLPAAAEEVAHLLARHPDAVALEDGGATAAAVLDALPGAAWVHLACHAISHPEKASKSGLYLHDGVLRVPEISAVDLRGGELAYLSACSTGQSSLFQADEAIHLASAFQLAGYRHVVATLWQVNDQVAAMAARRFYRLLGDSPTADGAAAALHDVTLRLRHRFPGEPELWAPFVHTGP